MSESGQRLVDLGPRIASGYMEGTYGGEDTECSIDGCNEPIKRGDTYFVDLWLTDSVSLPICRVCGPCERYGRKKAMERGEIQPPV